jgi:recombinational DNA repair protein (RecF pathway)
VQSDVQPRLKRCVQCFQSLRKTSFSKRQAQLLDAKCRACVQELERAAAASPAHVASALLFVLFAQWLLL